MYQIFVRKASHEHASTEVVMHLDSLLWDKGEQYPFVSPAWSPQTPTQQELDVSRVRAGAAVLEAPLHSRSESGMAKYR